MGIVATEHVCGPLDFTHVELTSGPRRVLKIATGELLKHYGQGAADFRFQSEELRVSFTVVDVKRPILSVSRLTDRGIQTFIQAAKQMLRRSDGVVVALTRRGGLFVLQCQVVPCPMVLALVDEEPAVEAPSPPPSDERWTANCWDEKRWHRQWHSSILHLENHSVMSGGITDIPYQAWCNFCIRACGRENRHESRSQVQPGTPVIQFYCCLRKTEEDAPMVTVLVAVDTVYKQMVAIPFEKKGQ